MDRRSGKKLSMIGGSKMHRRGFLKRIRKSVFLFLLIAVFLFGCTPKTEVNKETSTESNAEPIEMTEEEKVIMAAKSCMEGKELSYIDLIAQLGEQGFLPDIAVYGADNCDVDWYQLAAEYAKQIENNTQSRWGGIREYNSLIWDLKAAGFSGEQALYGADNCGIDWNEEAVEAAKEYLQEFSYSRDVLISKLKADFSHEQAIYAVEAIESNELETASLPEGLTAYADYPSIPDFGATYGKAQTESYQEFWKDSCYLEIEVLKAKYNLEEVFVYEKCTNFDSISYQKDLEACGFMQYLELYDFSVVNWDLESYDIGNFRAYSNDDYVVCMNQNPYLVEGGSASAVFIFSTTSSGSILDSISTANIDSSSSTTNATMGEKNALYSAKDYLEYVGGFSYLGMIEQLEFEGYSSAEAKYGADYCGADWYEQAALSAKQYLDAMSFSRQELIEQLEYEGFTYDQAVYGVEQNGY